MHASFSGHTAQRCRYRGLMVVILALTSTMISCSGRRPPETRFVETLQPKPNAEDVPQELGLTDVTLGHGDVISMVVHRHADLSRETRVPASGIVFFPLIGEMDVKDLTGTELRRLLTEELDKYIVNPQVSLNITVRRSDKVLVLGEVRNPGVYALGTQMSVVEAIVRAGSYTNEGSERRVLLLRKREDGIQTTVLDVERALTMGEFEHNPYLQRGDVLFVPKSTVTEMDRFARHISTWLAPILQAETAVLLGYQAYDRVGETGVFIGLD